jgi:two-component system phosphate regulon response regulator PhoB
MSLVLIADDDPDIRELVSFKLERSGHQVVAAADGDEALAEVRATTPDLVLLDIMMPRRTGIEVCRELRDDPTTANLPVILLTAKAQEADVERGFQAGATDYIVKPFSPRELLMRVNTALGRTAP